MDILGTLQKLSMESGFAAFFVTDGGWKNLIMIIIAFVLLYLGIVKKFEPLLLCGIAFGCLLTNLSYFIGMGENALYHPELWEAFLDEASPYYHSYGHVMANAGLLDFFYIGVKAGIYPSLIFLGVGAMTDCWLTPRACFSALRLSSAFSSHSSALSLWASQVPRALPSASSAAPTARPQYS